MKNIIAAFAFLVATVTVSAMAFTPPIGVVADGLPTLNSAGDHVYASAYVSDTTGTVTTIAAAGTYVTVATASPMTAGETDGSGCITYTLASNKFTVAARCGVGELRLRACLNDIVGANSAAVNGAWHRVRAGTTTVASPKMRSTMASTAVRLSAGCIEQIVDADLSDTYDFRFDSGTNADTVTTRGATFTVEKVLSK